MREDREHLIAVWREKLEVAHVAYRSARAQAWSAHLDRVDLPRPDGDFAFKRANIVETAALIEYRRVLEIFSAVAVEGKRPPDETR